jgi:hypothetical protein
MNSWAAENPNRLAPSDSQIITDIMKYCWGDEQEAVEAIEKSAVAGEGGAHVFNADVSLDA